MDDASNRIDGARNNQFDADGTGEMKDEIDVANFAFHQNDVGGVGDKGTEIRILF